MKLEGYQHLRHVSTVRHSVRKEAEFIKNTELPQNVIEDRLLHDVNSIVFALNIKTGID